MEWVKRGLFKVGEMTDIICWLTHSWKGSRGQYNNGGVGERLLEC